MITCTYNAAKEKEKWFILRGFPSDLTSLFDHLLSRDRSYLEFCIHNSPDRELNNALANFVWVLSLYKLYHTVYTICNLLFNFLSWESLMLVFDHLFFSLLFTIILFESATVDVPVFCRWIFKLFAYMFIGLLYYEYFCSNSWYTVSICLSRHTVVQ